MLLGYHEWFITLLKRKIIRHTNRVYPRSKTRFVGNAFDQVTIAINTRTVSAQGFPKIA